MLNVLFELHSLYITAGHSAPQALEKSTIPDKQAGATGT